MYPSSSARCKNLVLDAGPLLSLSPLRGLAETYLTVPQVLDELKDKRAREHFERLGLNAGVRIEVREADKAALAHVIQSAKKTGDYSVLSYADLCVLALTYSLDVRGKEEAKLKTDSAVNGTSTSASGPAPTSQESDSTDEPNRRDELEAHKPQEIIDVVEKISSTSIDDVGDPAQDLPENEHENQEQEPLDVELHREGGGDPSPRPPTASSAQPQAISPPAPLYDDPSDSSDGEGEWITPSNVALHKSRALSLLPSSSPSKGKGKDNNEEAIFAGCMTADFAMQNVLLQMGLSLVSTEGKRIEKVKSWVLRCHACFKICKDNSKKFCPSCGNPTLLRASVTIASPTASETAPAMQIHLKPNFQYRTRGTIYSIPSPKPGSAKTGPGEGLILREDQAEYMRAKKLANGKREREEKKMVKGMMGKDGLEGGVKVGSWMDPDWVPDIMSAGTGGKGRSGNNGDMPVIGYGKKNPNERRRKR